MYKKRLFSPEEMQAAFNGTNSQKYIITKKELEKDKYSSQGAMQLIIDIFSSLD